MGANLDWLVKEYGGLVQEKENTFATVAAPAEAVQNDPNGLALLFINFGAFDIFLTLRQDLAAGVGIRLAANGGGTSMNVRDDLTLPARGWFASSPGGASTLYFLRLSVPVLIPQTK